MPNTIKYNTSSESNALSIGSMHVGTGDVPKGPTESTEYYNGINPPNGGYTIYIHKTTGGPSILCPTGDAELIDITNGIAVESYTTVNECFNYFDGQDDKMVMHNPINYLVTDGLVFCVNAGIIPSYPRNNNTWYDLSGGGDDGTLVNNPTFNSNGYLGFDGVDDYVDIDSTIGLGNPCTVIIIAKVESSGNYTMFAPNSNGVDNWLGTNGTQLELFATQTADTNNFVLRGSGLVTNGTRWQQLACTIDGDTAKVWINGEEKNSTTRTFTIGGWSSTAAIGRRGVISQRYFPGKIASVAGYSKSFTSNEMKQNYYQAPIVTDSLAFAVDAGNLVSFEKNTTTTYNLAGDSPNGTLVNGVGWNNGGGGVWSFDRVDDYIDLGNMPAEMDPGTDGAFSFGGWIKTSNESGFQKWIRLSNYYFYLNTGSTNIRIFYGGTPIDFSVTFSHGEWVHWFAVVDKPNNIIRIYKNGAQVAINSSATATGGMGTSVGMIGDTAGEQLGGEVGSVHYYKKALSAEEVQQNYQANINKFN